MRILLASLICMAAIAHAQDPGKAQPSDPDAALKLRGDRLPPIKYKDMTPAQKAMADRALGWKRSYWRLQRSPAEPGIGGRHANFAREYLAVGEAERTRDPD